MVKSIAAGKDIACAQALDLGTILGPVRPELDLVEKWLQTNLIDDNPFVADLLSQIFKAGGKRIRPGLVLLSTRASQNEPMGHLAIILAVLTELIHTASLVHDDVIDAASIRRGHVTVNSKWNDKLAVLLGDLLFAQASICLSRLMNPSIVGIYGQVLGDLCAGELNQMKHKFTTKVDWDHYIGKTFSKTASLFQAGCKSAAILNRADDKTISALSDYGLNLGICFQIIDDLLDVTGTTFELGKSAGSDLAQGVITAPALFILDGKDKAQERLKHLIDKRVVLENDGLEEALGLIRGNGGIEKTIELAHSYNQKCHEALSQLAPSPDCDALEQVADFIMARTS